MICSICSHIAFCNNIFSFTILMSWNQMWQMRCGSEKTCWSTQLQIIGKWAELDWNSHSRLDFLLNMTQNAGLRHLFESLSRTQWSVWHVIWFWTNANRKLAHLDALVQLYESYVIVHRQSRVVLFMDWDRLDQKDLLLLIVYSLVKLSNKDSHTTEKLSRENIQSLSFIPVR